MSDIIKLHIGCGKIYINGWVNIDIDSEESDLQHDMRKPLPFENGSVDFIYNEHFIEHLTVDEGLAVLRDFYRVLKPGGVVRIATGDLRYVLFKYFFFWRRQDWIQKKYKFIKTRAEMVNVGLREWGHQYLYDYEELARRIKEAGFSQVRRRSFNKSPHRELTGMETRKDSKLVVEAIK